MRLELGLVTLCAALVAWPERPARADKPPVEIQIVEDEGDGLFTPDAAKKPDANAKKKDAPKGDAKDDDAPSIEDIQRARSAPGGEVQRDADSSFDELEALERAKGANAPLGGADDRAAAAGRERAVKAPSAEEQARIEARTGDAAPKGEVSKGDPSKGAAQGKVQLRAADPATGVNYGIGSWTSWWERPEARQPGDLVLTYALGGYGGGAYHGLTLEGIFNEWGGLALTVQAGVQSRWQGMHHGGGTLDARDLDFFLGGRSAGPALYSSDTALDRAILHMETLSLNIHPSDGHGFELTPTVGLSHFGYDVKLETGELLRGGAGYLRLGGQLTYTHKRFLVGLDLGWYPVELFRYALEEKGPRGRLEVVERTEESDSRRATVAVFVGASF